MSNPLDPVIGWFSVTRDCMRITSRVLERGIRDAITPKHVFSQRSVPESLASVEEAKTQVEDFVVLALVSTFERCVRDFLAGLPRNAASGTTPLDEAVRTELLKDLEFWRLSDRLLAVFAAHLPAQLIGQVKQVVEYRNWIAHGRSAAKTPTNVVPQYAYKVLSEFLQQAGII